MFYYREKFKEQEIYQNRWIRVSKKGSIIGHSMHGLKCMLSNWSGLSVQAVTRAAESTGWLAGLWARTLCAASKSKIVPGDRKGSKLVTFPLSNCFPASSCRFCRSAVCKIRSPVGTTDWSVGRTGMAGATVSEVQSCSSKHTMQLDAGSIRRWASACAHRADAWHPPVLCPTISIFWWETKWYHLVLLSGTVVPFSVTKWYHLVLLSGTTSYY